MKRRGSMRVIPDTEWLYQTLDSTREFHHDWILFSVWNPRILQNIFKTNNKNECCIPIHHQTFFYILEKLFCIYTYDNELNFKALGNNPVMVRIEEIDKNLEGSSFLNNKPLKLKAREVKLQNSFKNETPTSGVVTLVCGDTLAEIINGIISPADVLIISGSSYIFDSNSKTRTILLNLNINREKLQIFRIPFINEEISRPFQLIEKVKPYGPNVFLFRHLAWDPTTNHQIDKMGLKIFTAEEQKENMRNSFGKVCGVGNPGFFYMPIHRYMSAVAIFDFLINQIPPIRLDAECVNFEDVTELSQSLYSVETEEMLVLIFKKFRKIVVFMLLLLVFFICLNYGCYLMD